MGKIKLYWSVISNPCVAAKLVADILKIPLEEIELDLMNGGSRTPEYLNLNPQGKAPLLDDNGLIIPESRAIMQYLVDKYAENDSLYPKDLGRRALVDARLYFDNGTLWPVLHEVYAPLFCGETVKEEEIKKVHDTIQIIEEFLKRNKWIAGPTMTIADISFACIVAGLPTLFNLDLSPYTKVVNWLEECKKSIPNYKLIEEGTMVLKAVMDKIPKKS